MKNKIRLIFFIVIFISIFISDYAFAVGGPGIVIIHRPNPPQSIHIEVNQ